MSILLLFWGIFLRVFLNRILQGKSALGRELERGEAIMWWFFRNFGLIKQDQSLVNDFNKKL